MDYENVVVSPEPTEEKQPNQIIRYAIMGVIGVVVLAVVIAVLSMFLPAKFTVRDGNSIDWELNDDDQLVFLFNGKKQVEVEDDITEEISGYKSDTERYFSVSTDYNKKYALFMTESEADEDGKVDYGDLYIVTEKKVQRVAEDVKTYTISPFGDTFFYIADDNLYFGELKNPTKAKKLDSDVNGIESIAPDGESFVYSKLDEKKADSKDDEDEESPSADAKEAETVVEYYISTGGKKGVKFEKKDSSIYYISNDAKYIYYMKDEKFYVNDTKIAEQKELTGSVAFNRDGSQMIYSVKTESDDETKIKTYIIEKAGEKQSIGEGALSTVLAPAGTTYYGIYYNTSSFAKCAIEVDDGEDSVYYYLKNLKGDAEKISSLKNASSISMLNDGKTVFYIKNGNLRSLKITKPDAEPTEYSGSDEDISTYDVTSNGKHIYARDTDGTLYYVKSTSKMQKIKDDVSYYYTTADGKVYFVNEDDELYYSTKSGSAKKVKEDIEYFSYSEISDDAYAISDGDYGVVNGKSFKKYFAVN